MSSEARAMRTGGRQRAGAVPQEAVRITQQFRERHNMTYELDCSGAKVVVRVFFPLEANTPSGWRVEVCSRESADGSPLAATASSRAQALESIGRAWNDASAMNVRVPLDWAGIARAMTAVRAI